MLDRRARHGSSSFQLNGTLIPTPAHARSASEARKMAVTLERNGYAEHGIPVKENHPDARV
jgi:hypothetical protein